MATETKSKDSSITREREFLSWAMTSAVGMLVMVSVRSYVDIVVKQTLEPLLRPVFGKSLGDVVHLGPFQFQPIDMLNHFVQATLLLIVAFLLVRMFTLDVKK